MPVGDRTIDVVLATHPDKDHIGGLVDVLARYEVAQLMRTENRNDTVVSNAYDQAAKAEAVTVWYARTGQVLSLGASTTLTIYSPAGDTTEAESNTASIVAQLKYGDIEFLLTGDAPLSIEEYLVRTYGASLESEVLKVGHHGSRTSTAENFVRTVAPTFAVVSAGRDNQYGHPHREVVERLSTAGVQVLNTAKQGTIVFKTDGVKVWRE
jgi:competence protein ComEC